MSYIEASEMASICRKDINTIVKKAILKEKASNARILYAGINPENPQTMVIRKVVELFKGKFFYEETVFNPVIKSVHTTLSTCDKQFDNIVSVDQKLYELKYRPNMDAVSATSYARELTDHPGQVFHNTMISEFGRCSGFLHGLMNTCFYWKVSRYLNNKK